MLIGGIVLAVCGIFLVGTVAVYRRETEADDRRALLKGGSPGAVGTAPRPHRRPRPCARGVAFTLP
jgi:hypothetical protein